MLETSILTILACPACKERLEPVTADFIAQSSKSPAPMSFIEGGLLCRKHNRVFVIQQGIPILLFDQSISLT